MTKVVLTEKPSVARDIARCLSVHSRHDGYYEGNGYQITWAFGHLVELKEPEDYTRAWKRWTLESLPIIPERFELKARKDGSSNKQLAVIRRLFQNSDEIICATDAGREGELIFRYILTWAECRHKPCKRLWISSMTDEAIRTGFDQLRESQSYEGLYRAAKCRSEADWIVGLNATRFHTVKYGRGSNLWTLGRVQTPVLALVVQRDLEIERFESKDFWELNTTYGGASFQYVGGRFVQKTEADALLNRIRDHEFRVASVAGKQDRVLPPLPYDLTDLQKDMSLRFGFTADRTLKTAQALYEKKHITYPRTDSRRLSSDLKNGIKPLLRQLQQRFKEALDGLDIDGLPMTDRLFDDTRVTDHHAIIPTARLPGPMTDDESTIYDSIALRLIAAFHPPCVKEVTTVYGQTEDVEFKTAGTVIIEPGWQRLYHQSADAENARDQKILPKFKAGESGSHRPGIHQGKTTPPKAYTEAGLLSMMESAGKTCDDEAIREALKEKGLGTPATRASIIEVLIKRNYIVRQKKSLLSTGSGRRLIALIRDERLKSAALTGEWESRLKKIERGTYDPDRFMFEIADFTRSMLKAANGDEIDDSRWGDCPLCGKAVIEGRKGYGCGDWKNGCRFVLWKRSYGVTITPEMARELLQYRRTRSACVVTIDNDEFDALLTLDERGDIGYARQRPARSRSAFQTSVSQ
ncbi:MAG: DNA topoisomerase 3 [Gammaproteobacteria bacterium]